MFFLVSDLSAKGFWIYPDGFVKELKECSHEEYIRAFGLNVSKAVENGFVCVAGLRKSLSFYFDYLTKDTKESIITLVMMEHPKEIFGSFHDTKVFEYKEFMEEKKWTKM